MKIRAFTLAIFIALLLGLSISVGWGEGKRRITIECDPKDPNYEDCMKDFRVEGKIMKPEAGMITARGKINYDALKRNESFLPRVIQSVKQKPF